MVAERLDVDTVGWYVGSTLHGENVLHKQRGCHLFALLRFYANFGLRCTCLPSTSSTSDIAALCSFRSHVHRQSSS